MNKILSELKSEGKPIEKEIYLFVESTIPVVLVGDTVAERAGDNNDI